MHGRSFILRKSQARARNCILGQRSGMEGTRDGLQQQQQQERVRDIEEGDGGGGDWVAQWHCLLQWQTRAIDLKSYMVSKRENTKYCKYTVILFIHTGMSRHCNVLTGSDSPFGDRLCLWTQAGWRQTRESEPQILFLDKGEKRREIKSRQTKHTAHYDAERKAKCYRRRMGRLFSSLPLVSSVLRWPATNLCQCQHEAFPKQSCVSNMGPTLTWAHTHVLDYIGLEKESHVEGKPSHISVGWHKIQQKQSEMSLSALMAHISQK